MNMQEAKRILEDGTIRPDGTLHNSTIDWDERNMLNGENYVTVHGELTLAQMKAILWFMGNATRPASIP